VNVAKKRPYAEAPNADKTHCRRRDAEVNTPTLFKAKGN